MRDYLVKLFGEKVGFRWIWFNCSAATLSALCWGLAYLHGKLSFSSHYLYLLMLGAVGAFIISGFMKTESLRAKGFKVAYATVLFPGFVLTLGFSSVVGGLIFLNSGIYSGSQLLVKKVLGLFGKKVKEEKSNDVVILETLTYRENAGHSINCNECGSDVFVSKEP